MDDQKFQCVECDDVMHEEAADRSRDWVDGTPCGMCVIEVELGYISPLPTWWVETEGGE